MASPRTSGATSLDGRIALVTGATSGIGQETAVGLAARGAQVVLVGRDRARAEAARKDVSERSGNPRVDVLLADFASLDAVRGLAREFGERYPALHLLVNVASDAHKFVPGGFDFADPMAERGFRFPKAVNGMRVYGMSKLANILFT